jgi:single-strand DNA-binding protein
MITVGLARIGNEPALRSVASGDSVMDLSLAFQYGRKGADGKFPTTWIRASMWGDRCTKLMPYLSKGQQVYVELADLHLNSYEKRDGSGTATELRARINSLNFAGDAKPKEQSAQPKVQSPQHGINELDDDIPF